MKYPTGFSGRACSTLILALSLGACGGGGGSDKPPVASSSLSSAPTGGGQLPSSSSLSSVAVSSSSVEPSSSSATSTSTSSLSSATFSVSSDSSSSSVIIVVPSSSSSVSSAEEASSSSRESSSSVVSLSSRSSVTPSSSSSSESSVDNTSSSSVSVSSSSSSSLLSSSSSSITSSSSSSESSLRSLSSSSRSFSSLSSSSLSSESSSSISSSSSSISLSSSSFSSWSSSSSSLSSLSSSSSSFSSVSSSSSSAVSIIPAQPTNLMTNRQTGVGVSLSWTDVATNETGYVVKRASVEAPEDWQVLTDSLPANAVSYVDASVVSVEAKGYVYQIRAAHNESLSQPLNSPVINLLGYQHPKSGSLTPVSPASWNGANWSLGAHFEGDDLEVAVYSKNAQRILLEIYDHKHWADASFDRKAAEARRDYWLVKGPDNIWRGKLANVPEGTLYAFRVWGANWPWNESWQRGHSSAGYISDVHRTGAATDIGSYTGHRFNPNKVLTDPYAYELSHDTDTPEMLLHGDNGGIYGTGGVDVVPLVVGSKVTDFQYAGPITDSVVMDRRNVDTALWASKSVAIHTSVYTATKPNIPQQNTIQMEAHLRGLTQHPSTGNLRDLLTNYQQWFDNFNELENIPQAYRGTYKGAAMMAPYLKALGINVIQFLPVQETRNDVNDLNHPSAYANFWGYMTYSFFAPDRRFSSDKSYGGPTREFRAMVEAFNQQGIEVWMDVVYNHTGEGGNWGNPYVTGFTSYGGFDAAEYYHLNPFDKRSLESGATGTGNQINYSRAVNQKLVLDSLSYWADDMGVSGFRFDLAAVLGRDPDQHEGKSAAEYWPAVKAFNTNHPMLIGIRDFAANRSVKVVAEAWDLWGYPVGQFPNGWGEWNGRFRDSARKFLKGDPSGHAGISLNDAFYGDFNNFNDNGGPQKSVNFLVAHDGFTLADMVSYNLKNNNQAAPFGKSDGGNDNNDSWDSTGTAKPANLTAQEFRRQRLRNFWVFQFFSRGVPLIVYGDEFGRTQNGNNNPYALDNPATWNNYAMLASRAPQTVPLHPDYPAVNYHNNLGTGSNTNAQVNPLLVFARDIIQRRKNEPALRQANYAMPIFYASETGGALSSDARARRMHIAGSQVGGSDYVLLMNMWTDQVNFRFPMPPSGKKWVRIIDTAHWAEAATMNVWSDAQAWAVNDPANATYGVNPWTIVVFKAVPL